MSDVKKVAGRQIDRQKNRQTYGQTDRWIDKLFTFAPRWITRVW